MHELALAVSILDLAREHLTEAEAPRLRRIEVVVGRWIGVSVESLCFCFEAIVAGTPYAGARLVVEEPPVIGYCPRCQREQELAGSALFCPVCGRGGLTLRSGTEFYIRELQCDEIPAEVP